MTVFDCVMVYNEIDMLDLRMNILKDVVDYHVIVESGMTHSGLQKPDYIGQAIMDGRFDAFSDKIIYAYTHALEGEGSWARERWQRDYIGKILKYNASPEDWVIVADADEIPTPDAVRSVIDQQANPATLELDLYYYDFMHRVHQGWGIGMCQWGTCQDTNKIRRGEFPAWLKTHAIPSAGWHLSYFLTPEGVVDKLDAFMHAGDIAAHVPRDPRWLEERMKRGEDIFGRDIHIERIYGNSHLPMHVIRNMDHYVALNWVDPIATVDAHPQSIHGGAD